MAPASRFLAVLLALAGTGAAPGAEVAVEWDGDLARPEGREAYDRRLREVVAEARARVVAALGIEPRPTLIVKVHSRASFERAWLDEGLAERLAWSRRGQEEPSPGQWAELRQAREARRLTPLPREWALAPGDYLRSWAAVIFLERRLGRDRLLAVVRATLGGEPFERALGREAGLSGEGLERAFEDWVGGR